MDTDFTFPATSTPPPTPTPTAQQAAIVAARPHPAAPACRPLPFPRFAAAVSSSSPPPCRSPSPAATTGAPPVARTRAPTAAMAAAARQGPPPPPGAGGGDAAAAVEEVEDKMDLLWEDFNEELARGGSGLWASGSSDAESSSEPAAARGCAPVLRPSSRAGAAVRHCRRRAGTWVLLMRIFRRLFVIEKTAVSRRRLHAAAATTTGAS